MKDVDEGEHHAQQRCDSDELREDEGWAGAGGWGEKAEGENAPQACAEVDGDGAAGVVDEEAQLQSFDEQGDERAGDEADEDRGEWGEKSAAGRTSDEAGDPAIGAKVAVGLAVAESGGDDRG